MPCNLRVLLLLARCTRPFAACAADEACRAAFDELPSLKHSGNLDAHRFDREAEERFLSATPIDALAETSACFQRECVCEARASAETVHVVEGGLDEAEIAQIIDLAASINRTHPRAFGAANFSGKGEEEEEDDESVDDESARDESIDDLIGKVLSNATSRRAKKRARGLGRTAPPRVSAQSMTAHPSLIIVC